MAVRQDVDLRARNGREFGLHMIRIKAHIVKDAVPAMQTLLRTLLLAAVLISLVATLTPACAEFAAARDKNAKQTTIIVTPRGSSAGKKSLQVVLVCETEESRAQGLQGFRKLSSNEAALFVFPAPSVVTFWMGTVSYPIDIVFIGPDGIVAGVVPHCQPGSAALYGSGAAVTRVIETLAGSGIMFGDRIEVRHEYRVD